MTGLLVAAIAALVALGFGLYRKAIDGRVQVVGSPAAPTLDASRLATGLGSEATFVQFSAEVCAPCRATARVLAEVTAGLSGVEHIELDAATRLDLVNELGITRTPTVLLLDGTGAVRNRIVGAPRNTEVLAALEVLTESSDKR